MALLHDYIKTLIKDPMIKLDEEVVHICNIFQEQDAQRKGLKEYIKVEPERNKNILVVIECKGIYEETLGYLCLERDLVPGFYKASYWVGDKESPAEEIREWDIRADSAREVVRNYVRILKCF